MAYKTIFEQIIEKSKKILVLQRIQKVGRVKNLNGRKIILPVKKTSHNLVENLKIYRFFRQVLTEQ
jgi:hypothetical protein